MNHKQLDPKTKIILVIFGIIMTYRITNLMSEIMICLFLLIPYFLTRHYKKGIVILCLYLIQVYTAIYILPNISLRHFYYMISFFSVGLRLLSPTFIPTIYALSTTSTAEWLSLLKKWRAPKSLVTIIAVMGRFGPSMREDYRHIRQAMSFRGIGTTGIELMKHPLQSFEYIMVPLLLNATRTAENLTISALTKGITLPGKASSLIILNVSLLDYFILFLMLLLLILLYVKGLI